MNTISKILEQVLLEHVVEKSHMLSEAAKPMYKVGDNVTAWIQGGAPAKYKISGIAHIKVPIGDLKKGDPIYIAKKGNKTFYLTDADMRDPMNEKTLRPNGDVEDGDVLNDINEVDYKGMLEDGEGHIHFVFDNLSQAELMADKIEAKHLGDTDYYEDKGKVYLRVSLSVGYSGREISNIRKIERMVGMKAQAGSPEIWQADESINEGPGWSKSALAAFHRKPMPGRYFITNEDGKILEKGLKTSRSWVTYLQRMGKIGGGLGAHGVPKVVNIHDGKKDNQVVDQYFWVDKYGKGRYSIDIDNPTAGSHSKIDPKYVNYEEIEKQLGIKKESVNEAYKRINRNQAKLYEKGLKKVAKSVTFAKAAKQDGNIKLFVNYTKYTDRAKLKKAGEKMGLTYLSDGRVTNRPSADPIGGGVLGIQNNWMKFAKES